MPKLALTFYSVIRMLIADILQCASAPEEAGFGFISVAESFYRDGAALAAAIASNTRTIRLGTSVGVMLPLMPLTPHVGGLLMEGASFGLGMAIVTPSTMACLGPSGISGKRWGLSSQAGSSTPVAACR
jgi:hypothetical protein